MVGTTLVEIREHVESLASHDGAYVVRCGRTGERPSPTAGTRFESRAIAERASHAAEQYRAALRRYDPQLPYHELVVCQGVETYRPADPDSRTMDDRGHAALDTADEPASQTRNPSLVEFCLEVAATVPSPWDVAAQVVSRPSFEGSLRSPDSIEVQIHPRAALFGQPTLHRWSCGRSRLELNTPLHPVEVSYSR